MTTELDCRLRVSDTVMRHLIVRVDEELAMAERAKTHRKSSIRGSPAAPGCRPSRRILKVARRKGT